MKDILNPLQDTDIEIRIEQKRLLYNIIKLFKKYDIFYWLDYGTLLGAYRYGKIIPWDYDIDFSILHVEQKKVLKNVIPDLVKLGYEIQNPRTKQIGIHLGNFCFII